MNYIYYKYFNPGHEEFNLESHGWLIFTSLRFPSRTLTKQWELAWSWMVLWLPSVQQRSIKLNFPFPSWTRLRVYLYLSNLAKRPQSLWSDLIDVKLLFFKEVLLILFGIINIGNFCHRRSKVIFGIFISLEDIFIETRLSSNNKSISLNFMDF